MTMPRPAKTVDITMAMILVRSTLMPASPATSMSCPTARMSCPSFVFLNHMMNRHKRPMTIRVSTGILTPPMRIASRLSRYCLICRRLTVLRTPYPLGSLMDECMIGIMEPIIYRTTSWYKPFMKKLMI